jgi:NhaP-type Na+/H+ and K+/H+ antiporter
MAKTKEQHESEILVTIQKHKLMKIQHIFSHYTDLKSSQFYNLELEKSETIKEAISINKTKAVSYMLNKWIASENPTLQISAFKVLCDEDERKKLSMQFVESENTHSLKKFEIEILGRK